MGGRRGRDRKSNLVGGGGGGGGKDRESLILWLVVLGIARLCAGDVS